ncbi:hypothetical protein J6590_054482 [Homalodisca vitripennis]|nr:hypothetical protein J6590_054482 [Homalodisca vitripennis]
MLYDWKRLLGPTGRRYRQDQFVNGVISLPWPGRGRVELDRTNWRVTDVIGLIPDQQLSINRECYECCAQLLVRNRSRARSEDQRKVTWVKKEGRLKWTQFRKKRMNIKGRLPARTGG